MPDNSFIDPELLDAHQQATGEAAPRKGGFLPMGILEEFIKFENENNKGKKIDLSSIEGTNAEGSDFFRNPYSYLAPKEQGVSRGRYGWTNRTGEVFINENNPKNWGLELANTLAHEALHSRRVDLPEDEKSYGFFRPEGSIDSRLLKNPDLRKNLPTYRMDSKEEQLANLFGYEGSLPKGKTMMETDFGKKLFSNPYWLGGGLNPDLVDYYMKETSYPYEPMYNKPEDYGHKISQALQELKKWAVKMGFNTVNR